MFCCTPFEQLWKNAGMRGLSVVPKRSEETRFFLLQSRGCDYKQIESLVGVGKINIASQIGIQHCPFCGSILVGWIQKNGAEFDRMAAASKIYLLE